MAFVFVGSNPFHALNAIFPGFCFFFTYANKILISWYDG